MDRAIGDRANTLDRAIGAATPPFYFTLDEGNSRVGHYNR